MGVLSDLGAGKTLDAMLGGSRGTAWPATVYLAASTTDPATALTEPTGGAYARVAITNDSTNWPASSSRQKANGVAVTFPTATANWGTIGWVALLDAATAGNQLAYDALTTAQPVTTGDVLQVPINGIVFSI